MSRRLTQEEVYEFIKNEGYTLLSSYEAASRKVEIRCPVGHEYNVVFNGFRTGSRCPTCAKEVIKNKLKTDINIVKQAFIDLGLTPLFDEYVNSKSPLLCICSCGSEYNTNYDNVKAGKKCRKCMGKRLSNRFSHDYEYVKNFFKENKCTLLSTSYTNGKKKLNYICECGTVSEIAFEKFKAGQRCKNCKTRKISEKTKGVPRPKWSGENHPHWKPEKTNEERIKDRKYEDYHLWRKQVFERDEFTCQCCGLVGTDLNAHHKDGYNWSFERRLDVSNGVTLCKGCHDDFHKIYGKGGNTEDQFEEFINSKLISK